MTKKIIFCENEDLDAALTFGSEIDIDTGPKPGAKIRAPIKTEGTGSKLQPRWGSRSIQDTYPDPGSSHVQGFSRSVTRLRMDRFRKLDGNEAWNLIEEKNFVDR